MQKTNKRCHKCLLNAVSTIVSNLENVIVKDEYRLFKASTFYVKLGPQNTGQSHKGNTGSQVITPYTGAAC